VFLQGGIPVARLQIRSTKVVVRGGIIRIYFDSLFKGFYALFVEAELIIRVAKIAVCASKVRLYFKGVFIGLYFLFAQPRLAVSKTKTEVGFGIIRFYFDSAFESFYRLCVISRAGVIYAEIIAGIGIVRVSLDGPLVSAYFCFSCFFGFYFSALGKLWCFMVCILPAKGTVLLTILTIFSQKAKIFLELKKEVAIIEPERGGQLFWERCSK